MPQRRPLLAGLLGLGATPAKAQDAAWQPSHPVQCIIGFAPGGGADLIARAIVEAAQPLIPQPLVVVNRPGAGGTIAAQQVAALRRRRPYPADGRRQREHQHPRLPAAALRPEDQLPRGACG